MKASGFRAQGDFQEAAIWYRKAANLGHADAQCALAWMYETGTGVRLDKAEGYKWYFMAAGQGNAEAQLAVGLVLASGVAVKKDRIGAEFWFRQSAGQGCAEAMYQLGKLYAQGYGSGGSGENKLCEAYKWFQLAAGHGVARALPCLRALEQKMSQIQISEALLQVAEFQKKRD
ncbi:MAG: tetratricopeptide repeat protein [Candidatus Wallbacteria bacterium]|nr:tetratricopeptide repeat protein [Candidatus Wallbacteria bacterium]